MVTRNDLVTLAAIEQLLNARIEIWRVIIDEHGNELRRIYRGSFYAPRDSRTGEPPTSGG